MSADSDSQESIIVYEKYMVLMAWLDAHWTRNCQGGESREDDAFWQAFNDFKDACDRELTGQASKPHASKKTGEPEKVVALNSHLEETGSGGLDPYLVKPVPYISLGRPDVLGLTLLDDLDMAQWVMVDTDRTIEEATMAFCIQPDGLLKLEGVKELKGHLVSMHELVQSGLASTDRPLLVLVRMKLEGYAMLMDPVETQAATLEISCRRIQETWKAMKRRGGADGLFEQADLEEGSWHLSILDLQEEEEIGFLFTCHNLSVPATFLGALRGLTLKDLSNDSPRFRDMLVASEAEELAEHCRDIFCRARARKAFPGTPEAEAACALPDKLAARTPEACHVFRWTRTSVALRLECFDPKADDKTQPQIRGFCASLNQCQVPAGHSLPAAELLKKSLPEKAGSPPDLKAKWQPCLFGNVDMLAGSLIAEKNDVEDAAWMPITAYRSTPSVFELLAELRKNMKDRPSSPSRHISGWATTLIVPQPIDLRLDDGTPLISDLGVEQTEHFPFLSSVIAELTTSMFGKDSNIAGLMRWNMQTSGIPIILRRAFMVLFEKYLSLAAHPMRYETVLDIYDAMQTLWDVLRKWLPDIHRPAVPSIPSSVPRLQEQPVAFLFQFATAVESAIDLRLRRLFPESPRHEWDLDFRGSMCQVVMAGETVLRAALGIVRRNVIGENNSFRRLGVVNRMTVTAGIYHQLGGLGVEKNARLSYVDTDVSHLTHLSQLADYFHEAYHLIHEEMTLPPADDSSFDPDEEAGEPAPPPQGNVCQNLRAKLLPDGEKRGYLKEISGEVFVAMMMLLTIADGDDTLLWAQQGVTFASHPKSAFNAAEKSPLRKVKTSQKIHESYAAAMIPIGIISALIKPIKEELETLRQEALAAGTPPPDFLSHCLAKKKNRQTLDLISPTEALECFVSNCEALSLLLPDDFPVQPVATARASFTDASEHHWHHHVLQAFEKTWSQMISPNQLKILWNSALNVMSCFMADATDLKPGSADLGTAWKAVTVKADALMNQAGASNTPVSPLNIFKTFETTKKDGARFPALGTVFVIRALHWVWKRYLPRPHEDWALPPEKRKEWRLPRKVVSSPTGLQVEILWQKDGRPYSEKYHDYLVDVIRPEGFCILPDKRARRLQDQAVFMKSLWGISYIIRRRRLDAMIAQCKDMMDPASPEA